MADALTPVLTDEQIDALWVSTPDDPDGNEFVPFARAVEAAVLAAQAPAYPDRAVMQQALDALRAVRLNMLQNAPFLSGKAWGEVDLAIAALEKFIAP